MQPRPADGGRKAGSGSVAKAGFVIALNVIALKKGGPRGTALLFIEFAVLSPHFAAITTCGLVEPDLAF